MNNEVEMKSLMIFLLLSSLNAAAEEAKKLVQPTREVAIIVTKEGYYPKSLSVFEGEKIKFFVTSTVEEPNCLIVESHKVFMAANKGKVTEAEVVFENAGEFAFYCPSSKNDGKVVVLKKFSPKREVASEAQPWVPKEY
jgi:plastocyanin